MASNSNNALAVFSNYDDDIGIGYEYEMAAPGVGIYSTLPGNRYAYWSGTSMAAPNVSAAAAILRSKFSDKGKYTSRFIMGQLVSATESRASYSDLIYPLLNINDSLIKAPKPKVILSAFYMFNDPSISPANNGDGIAQPGETIDLGVAAFNYWGTATDVTISIDALSGGGVPNPHVELVKSSIKLNDIGIFANETNGFTYTDGMLTGVTNPLRIKIKEGTPNDIQIPINFTVTCKNGTDRTDTTVYNAYGDYKPSYTVIVQNGYAISGVISEDMTLTNDKYWIIQNNVLIPEGVTVTVEPGTQIQFWSADPANPYADSQDVYIQVEGRFIAEGTEEQPIEMFPGKGYETRSVVITGKSESYSDSDSSILDDDFSDSYSSLKYVNLINGLFKFYNKDDFGKPFCVTRIDHCNLIENIIIHPEIGVTVDYSFIYAKDISNTSF